MNIKELDKGVKVLYTLDEDWGVGIVDFVYTDGSVVVYFPDRKPSHPNCINKFRFYAKEIPYFKKVSY